MTKQHLALAVALATSLATSAHAQTKPIDPPPPPAPYQLDPAKRVPPPGDGRVAQPAMPQAAPPATGHAPMPADAPADGTTAAPMQPYAASPDPAATYGTPRSWEDGRGGFFVGAQGGKGWVYDDVDQTALLLNAGYRWQAGAVSLLGLEVAAGRLADTEDDGFRYDEVDYASIGFNGRFNFGRDNPVFAVVRAGYWSADSKIDGDFESYEADVDGGYVGLGLGVDFNRHVNMSVVYTNHVYFDELYWEDDELYYDANRADTLMLGIEARF